MQQNVFGYSKKNQHVTSYGTTQYNTIINYYILHYCIMLYLTVLNYTIQYTNLCTNHTILYYIYYVLYYILYYILTEHDMLEKNYYNNETCKTESWKHYFEKHYCIIESNNSITYNMTCHNITYHNVATYIMQHVV